MVCLTRCCPATRTITAQCSPKNLAPQVPGQDHMTCRSGVGKLTLPQFPHDWSVTRSKECGSGPGAWGPGVGLQFTVRFNPNSPNIPHFLWIMDYPEAASPLQIRKDFILPGEMTNLFRLKSACSLDGGAYCLAPDSEATQPTQTITKFISLPALSSQVGALRQHTADSAYKSPNIPWHELLPAAAQAPYMNALLPIATTACTPLGDVGLDGSSVLF